LGLGSLITPNQGRTDDFVILVEQDGAVHLAGESDGHDRFGCKAGGLERFANRECGGAPPVARVLFRPAGLRAGEIGVIFRARGEDCAEFIEDDGARSAGSNVDAKDWNTASFLSNTSLHDFSATLATLLMRRELFSGAKRKKQR
jgi:hypothetical protein